jgi:hypothetical protein
MLSMGIHGSYRTNSIYTQSKGRDIANCLFDTACLAYTLFTTVDTRSHKTNGILFSESFTTGFSRKVKSMKG